MGIVNESNFEAAGNALLAIAQEFQEYEAATTEKLRRAAAMLEQLLEANSSLKERVVQLTEQLATRDGGDVAVGAAEVLAGGGDPTRIDWGKPGPDIAGVPADPPVDEWVDPGE